jgi:hypothetical protein
MGREEECHVMTLKAIYDDKGLLLLVQLAFKSYDSSLFVYVNKAIYDDKGPFYWSN